MLDRAAAGAAFSKGVGAATDAGDFELLLLSTTNAAARVLCQTALKKRKRKRDLSVVTGYVG